MDISIILKIAGIGLLISIINSILKHCGKDELTTFTTIAGVIMVFFIILDMMSELFVDIKNIFGLY